MRIILISGAHPVPHRPRPWPAGARRAGQGRRQPASGASVTLDAPEHVGTIIAAMGDIRDLRSTTPTAVTFTLNQDTRSRMSDHRDTMIALGLGLLLVLGSVAGRSRVIAGETSTYTSLIGITFVAVAARHWYGHPGSASITLWVTWSLSCLLFYASIWCSEEPVSVVLQIALCAVLVALAYVFYDYARRVTRGKGKAGLMIGLESIVAYFVLTDLVGYRLPYESANRVMRLITVVTAIVVGVAYWVVLSGRQPRWPWGK